VRRQLGAPDLTGPQGVADGHHGSLLAQEAGFPNGTILFLDVESGGALPRALIAYLQAWVDHVETSTFYRTGIYCSHDRAAEIAEALEDVGQATFWCWHVNCAPPPGCAAVAAPAPQGCGYSAAAIWQFAQSPQPSGAGCQNDLRGACRQEYGGHRLEVDLDSALTPNPSRG
jgi:hypothetical protein